MASRRQQVVDLYMQEDEVKQFAGDSGFGQHLRSTAEKACDQMMEDGLLNASMSDAEAVDAMKRYLSRPI